MNIADLKWIQGKELDLLVESFSSSSHTVQIRGITQNEQIIGDHVVNTNRTLATSTIRITDIPIFLTARTVQTGVSRGQVYVRVSLRVDQVVVALFFAGYVTDTSAPIHPNGKIESSIEGPGLIRSITGTDPAANTEISQTVPSGARWKLLVLRFTLITDANAANRGVLVSFTDGIDIYHQTRQPDVQIASLTRTYNFALQTFFETTVNFTEYHNILPDIIMPAGDVFQTITGSLQAGDDYGAPNFVVEEWLEV